MISAQNLTKRFDNFVALEDVSCSIPSGCIYGMVGSNGAGKSTFLRILAGIYRADSGRICMDGEAVYENPHVKSRMVFVPDELYFLPGADLRRMRQLYAALYPHFDHERYEMLLEQFRLPANKSVSSFSKGMKRQAATLLALSARPDYILFDETFDGLDPVMRNFVRGLICGDVAERGATAIITSHSLRELEDTCDQLVLLHRGGVVLESDIQNLKTSVFKVQIAFSEPFDRSRFSNMEMLSYQQNGAVASFILRGEQEEILYRLRTMSPLLLEVLPLTLEETFICEMQQLGYDYHAVLEEMGREKETI